MWNVLSQPIIIVLFTLVCVLLGFSMWGTLGRTNESQKNIAILEQELGEISSQVSTLESQVQEAQTPLAKEKIIRDELLMQKPGEYVVQLPESAPLPQNSAAQTQLTPWQQWQEVWQRGIVSTRK